MGGFGGGVQLDAADVMGSVSHERLGAAQATGKRVLTPMMWSPLIKVRRSWFAIGSAPARVASCATSLIERRAANCASSRARRSEREAALREANQTGAAAPRTTDFGNIGPEIAITSVAGATSRRRSPGTSRRASTTSSTLV